MLLLYRGEHFDANFFYHSGIDIDHSFLLISGKNKTLIVPELNESLARSKFQGNVSVYQNPIKELQKKLNNRKVEVDGANLSLRLAKKLKTFCRLDDVTIQLLEKRARKKPGEIRKIAKAVRYTKEIFEDLDFKKAKTENELRKQLLMKTMELGLEPAFEPIVSTDKNTSYPHTQATNKKIGSLVMVDYGVRYQHYCSDVTRCFILDGDKKKKEQYDKLRHICHFVIDSLPEFEYGNEVDSLAQDLLEKSGFPKMPHSSGHGLGLDIHELPKLSKKSTNKIAGSAIAVEPSFYLKNYGMRFEETVDYTGKRPRIL
ncbi:MAG: M24 family metallopeptidase [Candidatus Micrarchaeota archaeon]